MRVCVVSYLFKKSNHGQSSICAIAAFIIMPFIPATGLGLGHRIRGQDPHNHGLACQKGNFHDAPGAFVGHHFKMIGFAPDDRAQSYNGINILSAGQL